MDIVIGVLGILADTATSGAAWDDRVCHRLERYFRWARVRIQGAGGSRDFRQEFAELASLAEGLGDNPLPASIEVRVSQGAERDGRVDAFVKKVVQLPGVVDVRTTAIGWPGSGRPSIRFGPRG